MLKDETFKVEKVESGREKEICAAEEEEQEKGVCDEEEEGKKNDFDDKRFVRKEV